MSFFSLTGESVLFQGAKSMLLEHLKSIPCRFYCLCFNPLYPLFRGQVPIVNTATGDRLPTLVVHCKIV